MNGENGDLQVSDSLDTVIFEYCRLKLVEKEEPTQARFQQALELGERMVAVSHIQAEYCHEIALAWAKKLYSGDECNTICTEIQFRNQNRLENVQGRIPVALTNLMSIVRRRATEINEAPKNIETIEDFVRKHPAVGLPTALPAVRNLLGILDILYGHIGGRLLLPSHTKSQEARELRSAQATSWDSRRVESNSEVDEETLKFKHILDQTADDVEFNMFYELFSNMSNVQTCELLRKSLAEESASGILTEDAMVQIFGVQEISKYGVREYLLGLEDGGLLQRLVGNLDCPMRDAEWTNRSPSLRTWLLDKSRLRLPIRQCLWIELHNIRSQVWSSRCIEGRFGQEFVSTHEIRPENIESMRKQWTLELAEETRENINAIENRVEMEEAKLSYSNDHYERESFIAEGSLPQLWVQVFFCLRDSNEEPDEACVSALNYAEEVARRQLTHWRGVNNY